MEHRIKEQHLDLVSDRTRAHTLRANQRRLSFSSFASVLMHALRRLGAHGTPCARAPCSTRRLKLLKIGARLKITTRRVGLSFSPAYPYAETLNQGLANLRKPPLWNASGEPEGSRVRTGPKSDAPPRSSHAPTAPTTSATPRKERPIALLLITNPSYGGNRSRSLRSIDEIKVTHNKHRRKSGIGDECGLSPKQRKRPRDATRNAIGRRTSKALDIAEALRSGHERPAADEASPSGFSDHVRVGAGHSRRCG